MITAILFGLSIGLIASDAPGNTPTMSSHIVLSGLLGDRYREASRNLFPMRERYSIESYKSNALGVPGALWWDWPGDQLGRVFSAIHVAKAHDWPGLDEYRKEIGDAILPLQKEDGHFGQELNGDYREIKLISGNAFALRGLMDAYSDTQEERYLTAAHRLGRFFEKAFDQWNDPKNRASYEFYGHCIDGLVRIYLQDKSQKWALEHAEKVAKLAGRDHHTHHTLSMYRGVVDLYRVNGDKTLLDKAKDYLKWCRESRTVTGGLPEGMPHSDQDEGCGYSDYVVLNLMMHEVVGDDLYLQEAENTMVNHLLMCQFSTGGFGHRRFGYDVIGGKLWQGWDGAFGSENPGCCSIWGDWALGQYAQYALRLNGDTLEVNVFPNASVLVKGLNEPIQIKSDFPIERYICLEDIDSSGKELTVSIRVPAGSTINKVLLNRKEAKYSIEGRRILISRTWKKEDKLAITLHQEIFVEPSEKVKGYHSVHQGPLVLGVSSKIVNTDEYQYVVIKEEKAYCENESGELGPRLEPVFHDGHLGTVKDPNRVRVLFKKK